MSRPPLDTLANPAAERLSRNRLVGRVNVIGVQTLYLKEVRRFLKVYMQTLVAPVATAGLFILVFALAFSQRRGDVDGTPFVAFLAPGVIMMTVIQNSFANSSSSIMIAKIQGIIVDLLMPPISAAEMTFSMIAGAVTRGLMVALLAGAIIFPFIGVGVAHPLWALFFVIIGSTLLSLAGLMTGVWADKFDQTAAVTNFFITPMAFLSGTFYKVSELPAPWDQISAFNPVFYLIDGLRYGVLGQSEANPWLGAAVCLGLTVVVGWLAWRMIASGYKLKS